jgi:dimethylargininase
VLGVALTGCLHLKSAVTQIGEDLLLLNPQWVSPAAFPGFRCLETDPQEPHAANALLVGDSVIYPTAYPRTRMRMESAGIQVGAVDVSELIKAEGAVTCCSLIFKTQTINALDLAAGFRIHLDATPLLAYNIV